MNCTYFLFTICIAVLKLLKLHSVDLASHLLCVNDGPSTICDRCRLWESNMAASSESITSAKHSIEKAVFHPTESMIRIYNFSDTLLNVSVNFHVMQLDNSLLLWIGNKDNLNNLAMAMRTKYDSIPCTTDIMGDTSDSSSARLSQKLAAKTSKQVFVSCQLPSDNLLLPEVEKRIIQEIKNHPEYF